VTPFIILNAFFYADDLKVYRSISDVDDCKLLQHDIDSVQNWCLDNGMKLNLSKTTHIFYSQDKQYLF
jgi:hypothetical protein